MSVKSEVFVYIDKTNPIDVSSFSSNGLWDLLNTSAQNLGQDDDDSKTRISFKVLSAVVVALHLRGALSGVIVVKKQQQQKYIHE